MTALIIVACVLILIAVLPVGGEIVYDEAGVAVTILIGPLKLRILPKKPPKKPKPEKIKKPKQKKPKKEKKTDEEQAAAKAKKGGKLQLLLQLVRLGLDFLGTFFHRKLLIRKLRLYVTYGGGDPARDAVSYGNSLAAAHGVLPLLHQLFRIRRQDVRLIYDPTGSGGMKIYAEAALTIRIGQVLALAVVYGVRALKILLSNKAKKENNKQEKAVSK